MSQKSVFVHPNANSSCTPAHPNRVHAPPLTPSTAAWLMTITVHILHPCTHLGPLSQMLQNLLFIQGGQTANGHVKAHTRLFNVHLQQQHRHRVPLTCARFTSCLSLYPGVLQSLCFIYFVITAKRRLSSQLVNPQTCQTRTLVRAWGGSS